MKPGNGKISLDQLVLKSLYFRYKEFITPVSVILVCLITVWIVILPQIQNWFAMRDEIATDTQQLSVLKQNLNAVTIMNDGNLDTLLQIASNALPADKDFAAIVNALTSAALQAGTQIGNYNFQIGDLSDTITPGPRRTSQQPDLELVISLPGNLSTTKSFVANLRRELPLSDVTSVSQNADNTVTVRVVFYYAPLPKIAFNDTVPLPVVSGKDEAFLKSLGGVTGENEPAVFIPTPSASPASPSATPKPTVAVSPTPIGQSPLGGASATSSASQQ